MSTLAVLVAIAGAVTLVRRRWRALLAGSATARRRRLPVLAVVAALLGTQALIGTPALADGCDPPNPERPGAGMVGAIDPPVGNGTKDSAYQQFGYAGMVWHTYEPEEQGGVAGCMIGDANATIDTWGGNQLFNVGKNVVGATNSLHYALMDGSLVKPLDEAVRAAANAFYDNIYVRWFGLAALLLAVLLFRQIWTGDLATLSKRSLWALAGMWLAAATVALPPLYTEVLDRMLLQKTSEIQAGFLDGSEDTVERHRLPTLLHDNVVYKNWLRGEFGSPDAPQAQAEGMNLLHAQAWTRTELADGKDADSTAAAAKETEFRAIDGRLGSAQGYFRGTDGSRTGSGFLAMFQGLAYGLFQLFAKAAVLLAQLLLRLGILAGPLVGLVAIIYHDVLRRLARAAGAVVFNVILLAALAGMHTILLQMIFGAGDSLNLLTQMLLATLVTLIFFAVGKPMRRMWQMVEMSVSAAGRVLPAGPGLLSRLRGRRGKEASPQDRFWESVRETDPDDVEAPQRGRGRVRPEAANPVAATAQRVDRRGSAATAALAELTRGRAGQDRAVDALPAGPKGYTGPTAALPSAGSSRLVDTPPVVDRSWDRLDDAVLVPSRITHGSGSGFGSGAGAALGSGSGFGAGDDEIARQFSRMAADMGVPSGPRRAETEVVAGRQVHVIFRPSRGFEVRDNNSGSSLG